MTVASIKRCLHLCADKSCFCLGSWLAILAPERLGDQLWFRDCVSLFRQPRRNRAVMCIHDRSASNKGRSLQGMQESANLRCASHHLFNRNVCKQLKAASGMNSELYFFRIRAPARFTQGVHCHCVWHWLAAIQRLYPISLGKQTS